MASQSSFHTWKEEPPSTSGVVLKKECLDKLPAVDLGQCIPYSQSGGEETVPLNIYSASSMEQLASIYRNQMESQGGFGTGSRGVSGHVAEMIEAGIGDHAKQSIVQILERVSLLKPIEKLLLYLRMPTGAAETDPLRQIQNPLGTRSEINDTINWVRSHLEHDPNVSIPKQDVYNDYVAYCERTRIKHLSTADFGKVMKQVFPGIRPRRLGTRGHSRYCYAAMRKATKLPPPAVPNIGSNKSQDDSNAAELVNNESHQWNIIKNWAENVLNHRFTDLNELATHIERTSGNDGISTDSKTLLQKRLLQRDSKDKKRLNDGPPKKRRKRRKANDEDNELAKEDCMELESTHGESGNEFIQIKQEDNSLQKQLMPINLTNDNERAQELQCTNMSCDSGLINYNNNTIDHKDTSKIPNIGSTTEPIPMAPMQLKMEKTNPLVDDNIHEQVICKKVRQAQQAKGIWIPSTATVAPSVPSTHPSYLMSNPNVVNRNLRPSLVDQNQLINSTGSNVAQDMLTETPMQLTRHNRESVARQGVSQNEIDMSGLVNTPYVAKSAPYIANDMQYSSMLPPNRIRRSRYGNQLEDTDTNNPNAEENFDTQQSGMNPQLNEKPDDVITDILIPRERVISICNMDKDALDDYLGDNSQEQDSEILQYFQSDDANESKSNDSNDDEDDNDLGPPQASYPFLENYQIFGNGKEKRPGNANENQSRPEINQLRQYLQQNLPPTTEPSTIDQNCLKTETNEIQSNYPMDVMQMQGSSTTNRPNARGGGSGSQRGRPKGIGNKRIYKNLTNKTLSNTEHLNMHKRNYNFVPISVAVNVSSLNNSTLMYSNTTSSNDGTSGSNLFLSPCSSDHIKKTYKMNSSGTGHDADDKSFVKGMRNRVNDVSASAPQSPLSNAQLYYGIDSVLYSNSCNQLTPAQMEGVDQRTGCALLRSRSVPLNKQSPIQIQPNVSFSAYPSNCNSMNATPVPTEFTDFNNPNIFEMLPDSGSSMITNPVKVEPQNLMCGFMDNEIQSRSLVHVSDLLGDLNQPDPGTNLNPTSRSVPSTPLPLQQNFFSGITNTGKSSNSSKLMFDISKSVPTTPVASISNPFRYSPEGNKRDFLINGNSIGSGKPIVQIIPAPIQATNNSVLSDELSTAEISELTQFDNCTDSIMGSDLLENL